MSMSLPIGMSPLDSLHQVICNLNLKEVDIALESHLARAAQGDKAYATFLLELLELEVRARQDTSLQQAIQRAQLPYTKYLDQFDFAFQPSIDGSQIRELQTQEKSGAGVGATISSSVSKNNIFLFFSYGH